MVSYIKIFFLSQTGLNIPDDIPSWIEDKQIKEWLRTLSVTLAESVHKYIYSITKLKNKNLLINVAVLLILKKGANNFGIMHN